MNTGATTYRDMLNRYVECLRDDFADLDLTTLQRGAVVRMVRNVLGSDEAQVRDALALPIWSVGRRPRDTCQEALVGSIGSVWSSPTPDLTDDEWSASVGRALAVLRNV